MVLLNVFIVYASHVYCGICMYWFVCFIRNKVFHFLLVVTCVLYAFRMTQHSNVKCFSSAQVSYLSLTADIGRAKHRAGGELAKGDGEGDRERGPKNTVS